jgi:hypothetical protein
VHRCSGEKFYLFIKQLTLECIKSDDVVTLAFDYIPNSELPAIPYMASGSGKPRSKYSKISVIHEVGTKAMMDTRLDR